MRREIRAYVHFFNMDYKDAQLVDIAASTSLKSDRLLKLTPSCYQQRRFWEYYTRDCLMLDDDLVAGYFDQVGGHLDGQTDRLCNFGSRLSFLASKRDIFKGIDGLKDEFRAILKHHTSLSVVLARQRPEREGVGILRVCNLGLGIDGRGVTCDVPCNDVIFSCHRCAVLGSTIAGHRS